MSVANYKSTRLLVEAVNKEMDTLRKQLMAVEPGNRDLNPEPQLRTLVEIRKLVEQLAEKAGQPTLEGVRDLAPLDYVATLKPLVPTYHQMLMVTDNLAPCLCGDLKANAVVVIVMGNDKTSVRAAHDPSRPEAAIAVEAIIAAIDEGTKPVVAEAAGEIEKFVGAGPLNPEEVAERAPRFAGSPDDSDYSCAGPNCDGACIDPEEPTPGSKQP